MSRPFCSPECRDRQGQLEDPETGAVIGWCPCRRTDPTPVQAKDAAMRQVAEASAMPAALLVIKDKAKTTAVFSANDVREEMDMAQVEGAVVGAAFARARKLGWIEPDRLVPSTQAETHGKPVMLWSSLLFDEAKAS